MSDEIEPSNGDYYRFERVFRQRYCDSVGAGRL